MRGVRLQNENYTDTRMASGASGASRLLARVRARTEQEQGDSPSTSAPHYVAAALGQPPYIALGNGVIIVQRKCSDWNC